MCYNISRFKTRFDSGCWLRGLWFGILHYVSRRVHIAYFAHCFVVVVIAMLFYFLQLLPYRMITTTRSVINALNLMLNQGIDVFFPVNIASIGLISHLVAWFLPPMIQVINEHGLGFEYHWFPLGSRKRVHDPLSDTSHGQQVRLFELAVRQLGRKSHFHFHVVLLTFVNF